MTERERKILEKCGLLYPEDKLCFFLKPCPFCGTEADHSISITDIVWTSKGDSTPKTFDKCSFTVRVFCPECGIEKTDHFVCGPLTLQIIENCCKDVFDEWNRRPSDG